MSTASSPAPDRAPAPDPSGVPVRVLFLGGLGRSGTTILERVLGELPGAVSAGELVHLWQRGVLDDERCGCGEAFSRCPFWTEVGARAYGGWDRAAAQRMIELHDRVDRTRHVPRVALPRLLGRRRAALEEYQRTFAALHHAIAAVSGCPVVIDSSKHPSLAYCLAGAPGVDLRVLHVVRDSRGVAYSWTKEVRRPESAGSEDLMTRYSPWTSSMLWNGHNVALSVLRRLGTTGRLLRYEDFVADPRGTVAGVADFAGLPSDAASLDFFDGRSVVLAASHTVAGNPVRFRTGPMELRRDDDWREQLPAPRRRLVSLLTLPLLTRYGYVGRRARRSS